MDNNLSNIHVSKNKKLIPLILGIISILLPLFWIVSEAILRMDILGILDHYFSDNFPLLGAAMGLTIFIVPGVLAIIGLFFGIINFISMRRRGLSSMALKTFFIFGSILCIVGLLIWIFELWLVYGLANI